MLKQFGVFAIFAIIAFWLGLTYGAFKIAFKIAQHFGVI